ncbi:hypothetical protein H2202_002287 [Exophiala xenobiotica]|nr:hypothetical protein H2202_002287 [Exophiala xenobiotica]
MDDTTFTALFLARFTRGESQWKMKPHADPKRWKGTLAKIALENDRVFQAMSNEYQPRFHSWLDESHSRNAQGRSFTETLSPRCDVLIATSGSLSTIARKGGVNFDRLETLVLDEFHKIMMSKEQKDQLDGAFFSPGRYHLDVMGSQVQRIISEGGKFITSADRDKWLRKDTRQFRSSQDPEGGNSISSTDRDKWLRKDASAAPLEFKHMRLQNPMLDLRKYSFILVSEHDLFDFTANQIATHVPGKILVFLHPEPKPMPFATLFERKSPTDALKSATVIILRPNALKRTL